MPTVPVEQLMYAVREVESGGVRGDRYKVVNSIGAHGAYQVMRQYIGPWTKEAFGRAYTPAEFLNSRSIQDRLAKFRLGRDQKKYGDWRAAAAVWFSGRPDWTSTASDGSTTVAGYIKKAQPHINSGRRVTVGGDTEGGTGTDRAGIFDDATGGLMAPFTLMAESIKGIAASIASVGQFAEFLLKLALPSTWVRIVCGVLGGAFFIFGLVVLGREAKGM